MISESQLHRELASGVSFPIGPHFPLSMALPRRLTCLSQDSRTEPMADSLSQSTPCVPPATLTPSSGSPSRVSPPSCAQKVRQLLLGASRSTYLDLGNRDLHVILRGGSRGTNYDSASVKTAASSVEKVSSPETPFLPAVMVDASHANSSKDHNNQPKVRFSSRGLSPSPTKTRLILSREQVIADVCAQLRAGEAGIMGVMIESNLEAGNQKTPNGKVGLSRGVSITDACVDWETTKPMLRALNDVSIAFVVG